jgi:hexosaminidase
MWGETVDSSDIEQTVWPRLGAIAEKLWSSATVTSCGPTSVTSTRGRELHRRHTRGGNSTGPEIEDAESETSFATAAANCTAINAAYPRIAAFRCLLNRRGVRAAPLMNAVAREAPRGPGGCLGQ